MLQHQEWSSRVFTRACLHLQDVTDVIVQKMAEASAILGGADMLHRNAPGTTVLPLADAAQTYVTQHMAVGIVSCVCIALVTAHLSTHLSNELTTPAEQPIDHAPLATNRPRPWTFSRLKYTAHPALLQSVPCTHGCKCASYVSTINFYTACVGVIGCCARVKRRLLM